MEVPSSACVTTGNRPLRRLRQTDPSLWLRAIDDRKSPRHEFQAKSLIEAEEGASQEHQQAAMIWTQLDGLIDDARGAGPGGWSGPSVRGDGWRAPDRDFLSEGELKNRTGDGRRRGDLMLVAMTNQPMVAAILGGLRTRRRALGP